MMGDPPAVERVLDVMTSATDAESHDGLEEKVPAEDPFSQISV